MCIFFTKKLLVVRAGEIVRWARSYGKEKEGETGGQWNKNFM